MSHFHYRALRRMAFGLAIAGALAGAGRAGAQLRAADGPGATGTSLQRATFKVSFYGIQRYASSTTSRENPASGCFDVQQRGTESGLTVARFESTRPTRLTIVRAPAGLPDFSYRVTARDQIYPLVARASWNTSGSSGYEVSSCVAGSRMWHAAPQPAHACGSAQIPNTGGSVEPESGTTLLFAGGQNLPSLVDPLAGCAFGEHRYGLYQARGRYSVADLLDPGLQKHVLILRSSSRETTPFSGRGGIGSHTVEMRTTVYVTFVRAA